MIDALTQKQRQLLALAILALVVVMIFTLTVAPLWALNRHYLDTIDELDNRLHILQRTAAEGHQTTGDHAVPVRDGPLVPGQVGRAAGGPE